MDSNQVDEKVVRRLMNKIIFKKTETINPEQSLILKWLRKSKK